MNVFLQKEGFLKRSILTESDSYYFLGRFLRVILHCRGNSRVWATSVVQDSVVSTEATDPSVETNEITSRKCTRAEKGNRSKYIHQNRSLK